VIPIIVNASCQQATKLLRNFIECLPAIALAQARQAGGFAAPEKVNNECSFVALPLRKKRVKKNRGCPF
jgi:hypothetical protein